ncbi:MAG: hypothetical protein WC346_01310 [Methanogenium sp.]|jgi:hypothetical protein
MRKIIPYLIIFIALAILVAGVLTLSRQKVLQRENPKIEITYVDLNATCPESLIEGADEKSLAIVPCKIIGWISNGKWSSDNILYLSASSSDMEIRDAVQSNVRSNLENASLEEEVTRKEMLLQDRLNESLNVAP